jgi:hypothetical protein
LRPLHLCETLLFCPFHPRHSFPYLIKITRMSTFQAAIKNITRQEGDTSDFEVIVPDIIDMTGASVKFQIKDSSGRIILARSTDDENIVLDEQQIYIVFQSADTKRKNGKFRYEVEVTTRYPAVAVYTILKGIWELTPELIN